jgi:DNA polymerase-3 subunit delta
MILKSYETNKINIGIQKFILFYGKNNGAKDEAISKLISNNNKKILTYDEKQILDNNELLFNNLLSDSLFGEEKIIVINRASDKIVKIINDLTEKNTTTSIIINSEILEKKSKLRSLFEKEKKLICVAFYPDNEQTLSKLAYNFLKENKVTISQSNINLIVNKCDGDRGVLKNELNKIVSYSLGNKKLTTEKIFKLINLIDNHSISELVDSCLVKNQRKTINILNENNINNEDSMIIIRTFINKLKKIIILSTDYQKNKNLEKTISNAKPAIFWKDREITKQQIVKLTPENIKQLIYKLSELELLIKKNINNSINLITDFILEQTLSYSNN